MNVRLLHYPSPRLAATAGSLPSHILRDLLLSSGDLLRSHIELVRHDLFEPRIQIRERLLDGLMLCRDKIQICGFQPIEKDNCIFCPEFYRDRRVRRPATQRIEQRRTSAF